MPFTVTRADQNARSGLQKVLKNPKYLVFLFAYFIGKVYFFLKISLNQMQRRKSTLCALLVKEKLTSLVKALPVNVISADVIAGESFILLLLCGI